MSGWVLMCSHQLPCKCSATPPHPLTPSPPVPLGSPSLSQSAGSLPSLPSSSRTRPAPVPRQSAAASSRCAQSVRCRGRQFVCPPTRGGRSTCRGGSRRRGCSSGRSRGRSLWLGPVVGGRGQVRVGRRRGGEREGRGERVGGAISQIFYVIVKIS